MLTLPAIGKPKPTRATRTKKQKPKTKGICPQCAFIFYTTPAHFPHCSKEMTPIVFHISKRNKTDKQVYEAAADRLCRLITEWRDGCKCVLENSGGVRCGEISQWGHVIPQGKSATLVYSLSNSFRQCESHNLLHRDVQATYYDWYQETFGRLAYKMLKEAWESNIGKHYNAEELRDLVIQYSDLYDMRYSFSTATMAEKVEAGFYGDVIRDAWIKDGRI